MSLDYPVRNEWLRVREERKWPRRARFVHVSAQGHVADIRHGVTYHKPVEDFPIVRIGLSRRVARRLQRAA